MRLRLQHGYVAFLHDIIMAGLSFWLALYLRVGDGISGTVGRVLPGTALMVVVAAAVFWGLGLYRGIWRYASLNDLIALVRAVTLVILIFVPVHVPPHPRRPAAALGAGDQLGRCSC